MTTEEQLVMLSDDEKQIVVYSGDKAYIEKSAEDKYDTKIRWLVSAHICVSFLCLGLCDTVIGPTLLDMKELYQTEINKISLLVLLRSIGSVIGLFIAGYLLDRFPRYRCYLLFVYCFGIGLFTCLTSHFGKLWLLFLGSFTYGLNSGSLDAGGNVLCLDAWRGLDSGPFMHGIHFSFALGGFIAPVLAEPFVRDKYDESPGVGNLTNATTNHLSVNDTLNLADIEPSKYFGIHTLYPIIGISTMLVSLGFLYFAFADPKVIRGSREENTDENSPNDLTHPEKSRQLKNLNLMLVGAMCAFFTFYVGQEVCYALYVATFSVESRLHLTKSDGAFVTAIFFGSFATMRFLAIFAAVKLRPIYIMILSFVFSLIGAVPLAIWGDSSVIVLQVCSSFLGIGMASVFATGFLWVEQYTPVTNKIGAAFTIASSIGADVFPLLLGQTFESMPMLIMYLQVGIIAACITLFVFTYFIGKKILSLKNEN